jgi:hypothetical protein
MANPALSLVLCPCALHALEHKQPVDCSCSAGAAQLLAESTEFEGTAPPRPQETWALNPEYEQHPEEDPEEPEDPEEAQQVTAGAGSAQDEAPQQPRESWASNPAFVEDPEKDSEQAWDIIDGHIRLRCMRAVALP